ncbi:MAG: polyprenyl synthetase family protein, partial [Rothia sp. (in: high G+C Gram-positive bacteria)]|nr:polyprenyl synthetase family protein [Rothia sp. (in: high G+C Gram-positive bacteria)]
MTPQPAVLAAIEQEQNAYLTALEEQMQAFFAEQREIMAGVSADTLPILEAIEALSTGGKRLRALLAYWGFRAAGGAAGDPAVVKAGVAIELFQSAALIHDDILDASETRRGAPSVHRQFEARHRQLGYKTDAAAYGVSSAILAGDMCLSWSEMVFSSIAQAGAGSEARYIFDLMRTEVMAGQYLDVVGEVVPAEAAEVA